MSNFVDQQYIKSFFKDKRVAIIGSAPSCLDNKGSDINAYDIVVRVNNYKIQGFEDRVGNRTDVFYSFYGSSIKKSREELIKDGVKLCMCKCADADCHTTNWHKKHGKEKGGNFGWIYRARQNFWFCDTYIPTREQYMKFFDLLGGHVPTTGFASILEILETEAKEIYVTGFTFFEPMSKGAPVIHNITDSWKTDKNIDDPVRHLPNLEKKILKDYYLSGKYPLEVDSKIKELFGV